MEEFEYRAMAAVQDAHWWFRGKRAIVARMIERFAAPRGRRLRSLDIGCGTGANLRLLARYGSACGVELHPLALALCRAHGCTDLARASAVALPLAAASFDIVALLDVLYHRALADVDRSLAEAYRVCRPGGLLVVTDSAFEFLRGPHDVVVHAARRFRRAEMAAFVARAGFEVVKCSYANGFLFPAAAFVRMFVRRRTRATRPTSSDLTLPPRPVNALLTAIYGLEARLLVHVDMGLGLSVLVVARRPAGVTVAARS